MHPVRLVFGGLGGDILSTFNLYPVILLSLDRDVCRGNDFSRN